MIIPKNPNEKKFNFWTKTMDYPLRKMSIFLAPFKTLIFWSKIILFYQEYRKKRFFSDLITPNKLTWRFSDLTCPKNTNEKNFDSWAKTEDYPLRKMSIFFRPFKTLVFWSKTYSFLSRISKNDLFEHNFFKNTNEKKFKFLAKTMH